MHELLFPLLRKRRSSACSRESSGTGCPALGQGVTRAEKGELRENCSLFPRSGEGGTAAVGSRRATTKSELVASTSTPLPPGTAGPAILAVISGSQEERTDQSLKSWVQLLVPSARETGPGPAGQELCPGRGPRTGAVDFQEPEAGRDSPRLGCMSPTSGKG